jgi:hypothetical protein
MTVRLKPHMPPSLAERAAARDPSTPAARLLVLMELALPDVLENPALPLLQLENPDLWADLDSQTMSALARAPGCPEGFAGWVLGLAAVPPGLATRLMQNPALPPEVRRQAFLRRRATEVPLGPDEQAASAAFLPADERALLARGGWGGAPTALLSEAELTQLRALGEEGERLALRHPGCPSAWLEPLALDADPSLKLWLVTHPRLSPQKLAGFLAAKDGTVRRLALRNPSLSPDQFREAALDPERCSAVAANPGLPAEWVAHLLTSPNEAVRHALARSAPLSPAHQLALAADPSPEVRAALRDSGRCTPEARARLEAP